MLIQTCTLISFVIYNIHTKIMNETIITAVNTQIQVQTQIIHPNPLFSLEWDAMQIIRIAWYIFCIFKILSIAIYTKPRPSIKERVLRKFFFSHNELLRFFTQDDKQKMEQLVDNTIKNASTAYQTGTSRIRKSTKKVNFQIEKNDYYEPHQSKEDFFNFTTTPFSKLFKPVQKLHLEQATTFQEKKHQQQFIERQDLIQLDEKEEELEEETSELIHKSQEGGNPNAEIVQDQKIEQSLI